MLRIVHIAGLVVLPLALAACGGDGIQRAPQDINVSPRSQEAYDPVFRDMQNEPVERKKQQQ